MLISNNNKCPQCGRRIARAIHSRYWQKEGINVSIIPSNGVPAVCIEGHLFVKSNLRDSLQL